MWKKYFNNAELPITFYYTDEGHAEVIKPGSVPRCLIGALSNVRKGKPCCFDAGSIGCFGGKRYLGFAEKIRPNFEYFLSCGIPGELEGERYKKSPEIVKDLMKKQPVFRAPARYIVFKKWDILEESDKPEVVIFFASEITKKIRTCKQFQNQRYAQFYLDISANNLMLIKIIRSNTIFTPKYIFM